MRCSALPEEPDSVIGRQVDYWRKQLAGVPDVLELPADRPAPPQASHRGAAIDVDLPDGLGVRVESLGRAVRGDTVHGAARRTRCALCRG